MFFLDANVHLVFRCMASIGLSITGSLVLPRGCANQKMKHFPDERWTAGKCLSALIQSI